MTTRFVGPIIAALACTILLRHVSQKRVLVRRVLRPPVYMQKQ